MVTCGGGSETRGPKEGAHLAGWRNGRKTSMSEESGQGDGTELVSELWACKWDGNHQTVQRSNMVQYQI